MNFMEIPTECFQLLIAFPSSTVCVCMWVHVNSIRKLSILLENLCCHCCYCHHHNCNEMLDRHSPLLSVSKWNGQSLQFFSITFRPTPPKAKCIKNNRILGYHFKLLPICNAIIWNEQKMKWKGFAFARQTFVQRFECIDFHCTYVFFRSDTKRFVCISKTLKKKKLQFEYLHEWPLAIGHSR